MSMNAAQPEVMDVLPHGRALSAAKTAGELRRAERLRLRREAKVAERSAKAAKAAGTRNATRATHDIALRRLVFVVCLQLGHAIILPSSVRPPSSIKLRSAKPKQYQPTRQEDGHGGAQQHDDHIVATARQDRVLVAQSQIDGLNDQIVTTYRRWAPVVTQWATFGGISAAGAGAMYLGGATWLGGPAIGVKAAKMYLTATASGTAWTLGFTGLFNGGERTVKSMGGTVAPPKVANLVTSTAVKAGLEEVPTAWLIPTDEPNAFAAGSWPGHRVVAVTQGLVDTLTTNELHAVIAHEIGHISHHDCGRAIQTASMVAGLRSTMRVGWQLLEGKSSSKSNQDDEDSSVAVGLLMVGVGSVSYAGSSLLVGREGA
uniref:Peptidase M48 domain-containing protein n=1 Tax=Florenciella parvula TaxID=236787 RepID=A0A7S2BRR0_9STRA